MIKYEFLNDIGVPFYDPINPCVIWSLIWRPEFNYYGGLQYSNDYGTNWIFWADTPPNANYPTLAMDSQGNFYFAQSTRLYKMDRITKAITEEIAWKSAFNPHSWLTWHWAEDAEGTLYTAPYTFVSTGGQYIYKKELGGNWQRIDILLSLSTQRHVHTLHVNPYDNNLYFAWGDGIPGRGIGVSVDKLLTYNIIAEVSNPGPTGLTFTDEAVYITTDVVGSQNYLKSTTDNTSFQTRFSIPAPYNISPTYFCRAVNRNEIWVTAYNETGDVNSRTAVFKLTKTDGVSSSWAASKIIVGPDKAIDGNDFYQIACGLNGIIPNSSPCVFIERQGRGGVFRFPRN